LKGGSVQLGPKLVQKLEERFGPAWTEPPFKFLHKLPEETLPVSLCHSPFEALALLQRADVRPVFALHEEGLLSILRQRLKDGKVERI
jgi:hypothetical protein